MDETDIKINGKWRYLYRAVDKEAKTIDFMLTKNGDKLAAKRFLSKAIDNNGVPETIDESAASRSALEEYSNEKDTSIEIRQLKYFNNTVEQDHRGVKRRTSHSRFQTI